MPTFQRLLSMTNVVDKLYIFTDGASKGNPGYGGWAGILISPEGTVREIGGKISKWFGVPKSATNQQMELFAAVKALEEAKAMALPHAIVLITDSKYLIQGMTEWMPGWIAKGWRKSDGGEITNLSLWKSLHILSNELNNSIQWKHVRGHQGNAGNERVDKIASAFAQSCENPAKRPSLYSGSAANYHLMGEIWIALQDLKSEEKS